jgi:transposase, IS5 family
MLIAYQMDGMKAQCDCRKRISMRVGLKNNINHYGYKNSICMDAEHGFIRRFEVTPANIRDDYVWADSEYSGERFKDLPSLAGFKNRIHDKV